MASPPTSTSFGSQKRPSSLDLGLKYGRRKNSWENDINESQTSANNSDSQTSTNMNVTQMTTNINDSHMKTSINVSQMTTTSNNNNCNIDESRTATIDDGKSLPVVPTNWTLDNNEEEDLVASVYSFLKAYLR
jgi:hypothetical protein